MVSVAEWFRRKIVVLVYAGSNPVRHPITGIVVDFLNRFYTNINVKGNDLKNLQNFLRNVVRG